MMELIEFSKKIAAFKKEASSLFPLNNINAPTLFKTKEYKVGIITSTLDEFESVAKYIDPLDELEINFDDSIIYYSGIIKNKGGALFNVILPFPTSMGIESTVCCTTKIISIFNPQYLFMSGVAAGNKNVTKIGDVIIAEKSLNYNEITEIQKSESAPNIKFMQNADSINKSFKSRLSIFSRSDVIKSIKNEYYNKSLITTDLDCHIGLMVTGSSLIRSSIHMAEINQSYHGVKGLDMETHGFYYAASHSKSSAPYFVSIKSVSDFGDDTNHKLSASQRKEYALHTSSSALFHFIREYLK